MACTPKAQQKKAPAKNKDGSTRKPMSDAHKKAIADSLKGRSLSSTHKQNISKSTKGVSKCRD
jgi:hypothetical protein